jgi:hypothetical protein
MTDSGRDSKRHTETDKTGQVKADTGRDSKRHTETDKTGQVRQIQAEKVRDAQR